MFEQNVFLSMNRYLNEKSIVGNFLKPFFPCCKILVRVVSQNFTNSRHSNKTIYSSKISGNNLYVKTGTFANWNDACKRK